MARPRTHDRQALVTAVCATIAGGTLVKDACVAHGFTAGQLREWVAADPVLAAPYARAREEQAHAIAEQALAIADEVAETSEAVARNRLRVDTRKWLASKIMPREYGDRVQQEVTGTDGGEIVVRVVREGRRITAS
jgi:hypothetical protein